MAAETARVSQAGASRGIPCLAVGRGETDGDANPEEARHGGDRQCHRDRSGGEREWVSTPARAWRWE